MSQQLQPQPQQYSQQPQTTTQGGANVGGGITGGGEQSLVFGTRNYLPENVRTEVITVLNRVLADAVVLETQAKFAHWNVKGRDFVGLHDLFDDIEEMFGKQADKVGERIAALGGQALGTARIAVQNSNVGPIPHDVTDGLDYVDILANQLAIHDAILHEAIHVAQEYDDIDTVDLLNEESNEVSKQLWFLESHLQTQAVNAIPIESGRSQQGQYGAQQMGGQSLSGQAQIGQPQTGQPQLGGQFGAQQTGAQQPPMQQGGVGGQTGTQTQR